MEIDPRSPMLVGCELCNYAAAAPVVQVSYIKKGIEDKQAWFRICRICIRRMQETIDERWSEKLK